MLSKESHIVRLLVNDNHDGLLILGGMGRPSTGALHTYLTGTYCSSAISR